ncbi:MAG: hypothetical protein K6G50_02585 [bacterium]|nr:hypothetical protein [bacterium]
MELTPQEILEKMAKYIESARKVKGIKDYLLTFNFMDNHADYLEEQLARHDEMVEEVGRIYNEEMLPIVKEIAAYLGEHKEDLDALIAREKEIEAMPIAVCPECGCEFRAPLPEDATEDPGASEEAETDGAEGETEPADEEAEPAESSEQDTEIAPESEDSEEAPEEHEEPLEPEPKIFMVDCPNCGYEVAVPYPEPVPEEAPEENEAGAVGAELSADEQPPEDI